MLLFNKRKNYAEWSDNRLVQAILEGNKDAIVYFFYTKYSATFQYHIIRLFNCKTDVEELIDEFFLFLQEDNWRRLRMFDNKVASLNTWVSTVSYRFFRDYRQSLLNMNDTVVAGDLWDRSYTDWAQNQESGIKIDVAKAIGMIRNERDRHIASSLFIDDRDYEQVAREFQLSVDYIYTIKNRLVKQLKNSLKDYRL